MQKAFQTGVSIALKIAVFGFTEYLQSWKLECFVASLLRWIVVYADCRIAESTTPTQARSNIA